MIKINFEKDLKIGKKDAILVVDMQNDFIPGGSLPVPEGDLIIKDINIVVNKFKKKGGYVVFSQDWHPQNHLSFASNHFGKEPFEEYTSEDGAIGPVLWTDHCVQNTQGANFHKDLNVEVADKIIKKGTNPNVDSYSVFQDNDKRSETGLREYLDSVAVKRIFVCGLALDYCCYYTAMDGINFGYSVCLLVDLTKGIDSPEGSIENALETMKKSGVKFANKASFR
ncbi:MAG: bifunctional nicotinamidase/pyrazinamidase [Promethearchaeota archaeon]|jgi:nicotinamidase/pyrazinamidase